ncbi:Hpt domain-containing protein [Asticcacaulis sp. AC402]|uniref:Hpt domain-containing protein n=1 Tax=Asticcacaulis sp. AC402 TaxID=1282361 RepID=UPI0003C3E40E|nr:Hpt domain-containing protein [Asticcacaulis sp. AC402]ESQ74022.1 histidine phosphotransferase [Asticcacaulis sp. AC402]
MQEKAQIIQVPNTLRAKVGGRLGALDAESIAKAEAALADLSTQFDSWLLEEVKKLEDVQATIKVEGLNASNVEQLFYRAHDLKGLGTTYGFPLITRICGSLCKLMDDESKRAEAPRVLVEAHLDAVRAIVRDQIKAENHPMGRVLAEALEQRVKEHLDVVQKA